MSDQDKIWFIYLTDHHEGPFTVSEVAEKVGAGLVNGQTLGWKDGMAEWVPVETIPELAPALSGGGGGGGAAPAAEAAPSLSDVGDNVSLAQLLSSQQQQDAGDSPGVDGGAGGLSIPASMPAEAPGSALSSMVSAAAPSGGGAEAGPAPHEEVWTVKIGGQVSGLYSLERIQQLASEGEIPGDAEVWHPGWTDFRAVQKVPALTQLTKRNVGTVNTGFANRPASLAGSTGRINVGGRPAGLAPLTAAADIGSDEEPTDTGIAAPKPGLLTKLKSLFKRKPKAAAASGRPGIVAAPAAGAAKSRAVGSIGPLLKRVVVPSLAISAVIGGAAFYFIVLASPLPSDLDVLPEDLEAMKAVVKASSDQGTRMHMAIARGTEDNIADDTNPKFYVATNAAEGTPVTITLVGKSGTIVNRINFEKTYTANVSKEKLATFELNDEGKPLPMGEYTMKVATEGAEPLTSERFLGGKKGAVYTRRLTQYKEKLDKEYSAEMEELRELVLTLKGAQTELAKRLADFKANWADAALRPKVTYEWKAYAGVFDGIVSQLDTKLMTRVKGTEEKYYPRAYQDISTTLNQLRQLAKAHGERIEGLAPSANPDELEAATAAGVASLEAFIAQAVVKSAFEVAKGASPAAAPEATAPATTPATPTSPAPAPTTAPTPTPNPATPPAAPSAAN